MALSDARLGTTSHSGEKWGRRAEQAYQKCRLCQGSRLQEKCGSATTASMLSPLRSVPVTSDASFVRIVIEPERLFSSTNCVCCYCNRDVRDEVCRERNGGGGGWRGGGEMAL